MSSVPGAATHVLFPAIDPIGIFAGNCFAKIAPGLVAVLRATTRTGRRFRISIVSVMPYPFVRT
jgi:hypothetical protein